MEGTTDPLDVFSPEITVKFPDIDEVFTGDDALGHGADEDRLAFFVEQHGVEYVLKYNRKLKTVDLRRPVFKSKADRKEHINFTYESVFLKPENITINPPVPMPNKS